MKLRTFIALSVTFVILIFSSVIFTMTDNDDIKQTIAYIIGPTCGAAFLLFLGVALFPED